MNCDCIQLVNDKLKPLDTELELTFQIKTSKVGGKLKNDFVSTLSVPTKWVEGVKKRKKPLHVTVTYCPFCGEKA